MNPDLSGFFVLPLYYETTHMDHLEFYKYQGTGNDFVMIDDRERDFDLDAHDLIRRLCERRFGIGADGLILIRDHRTADFEMVYYNADGYQTSLCGNGSRCAVHFAGFLGMVRQECTFQTIEGELKAKLTGNQVEINMPDVEEMEQIEGDYFLHTGSPHYVKFVHDVEKFPVYENGMKIRNSARFKKEGTNVNFVESVSDGVIFVRTYERGVENETYSCGTGVTAAAIAYGSMNGRSSINVKTLGGELKVRFSPVDSDRFCHVYLKGPAQMVYRGTVDIRRL